MQIEENALVKQMIEVLEEAGWENTYSDYDLLIFKQIGASPESDHVFKIMEEDGEIIVEESSEGELIENMFMDPSGGDISAFEDLVDNAEGGLYYA